MSQQYHEEFHADRPQFTYAGYEGMAENDDYFRYTSNGQKLSLRVSPPLWQRIGLALISLLLWCAILLCFQLAWDLTWQQDLTWLYDSNVARIILVFVPLLTTLLLIYVNVLFNRKRYDSRR